MSHTKLIDLIERMHKQLIETSPCSGPSSPAANFCSKRDCLSFPCENLKLIREWEKLKDKK